MRDYFCSNPYFRRKDNQSTKCIIRVMVLRCLKFMPLGWNPLCRPQALQIWMASLLQDRVPYLAIVKRLQKYSDNHFYTVLLVGVLATASCFP